MKNTSCLLGAHTSTAGSLCTALLQGVEIGASTIQFFTSNQRQWKGRAIHPADLEQWRSTLQETGLQELMSHSSYLINLGSPNEESRVKSQKAFREEIERCQQLQVSYLNFHPGAALEESSEACLDRIVQSLLSMAPFLQNNPLRLLLETTAGQGSSVGHTFSQLGYIVEKVKGSLPIGVCIDTCHIFAAGYDIRSQKTWDQTLVEFDRLVGLHHLFAFHLNDSIKGLGSHVDRHAPLGEGQIGWESFAFLMRDPRVAHLPKYLETPGGPSLWKQEIEALCNLQKHS